MKFSLRDKLSYKSISLLISNFGIMICCVLVGLELEICSNSNFEKSPQNLQKDIWKHSSEVETHTVETHIHRLRKKFLDKFKDKNFIKNNNKGYYI